MQTKFKRHAKPVMSFVSNPKNKFVTGDKKEDLNEIINMGCM
jgi:hypothetical protein